ncbi:hypothetical protein H0H81_009388 [Sphagnurus paluster]|uniref:Gylcosyl hydrolase 115 C-terminal domain-containing protein n=1 Tax=Sphagnurus paluster TaxID=117069 RepID=A0A9P7FPX9_9AGAR|nr:hypothetical protein H0H81_009388 [Sphagnurus paluster]
MPRPGDNPNQCAQGYNCPPPSVSLDPYSPFGNRFIDVGAGGPAAFTFTATSSVPWISISPASGSISPSTPEQRVFVSVKDWSQLKDGANTATIKFTATAVAQPRLSVDVVFTATKRTLPNNFKGFVEGSGVISIEAAHATRNTPVNGVSWKELPGYGRTLSGMSTFPRLGNNDVGFAPGSGPSLTLPNGGGITITIYVAPSWNAGEKNRPLSFAVQLDGGAPKTQQFFPQPKPGGLPGAWGGADGFVANAIISVVTTFAGITPGAHTLKVCAIIPNSLINQSDSEDITM